MLCTAEQLHMSRYQRDMAALARRKESRCFTVTSVDCTPRRMLCVGRSTVFRQPHNIGIDTEVPNQSYAPLGTDGGSLALGRQKCALPNSKQPGLTHHDTVDSSHGYKPSAKLPVHPIQRCLPFMTIIVTSDQTFRPGSGPGERLLSPPVSGCPSLSFACWTPCTL